MANLTADKAQAIYNDSRSAGVVNFPISKLLKIQAKKAIQEAITTFPSLRETIESGHHKSLSDPRLINEVAICIILLKWCDSYKLMTSRTNHIRPNSDRHIVENWIARNIPETQSGRPNDHGYYLYGYELLIAACLFFPNQTTKFIHTCPKHCFIELALRRTDLIKAAEFVVAEELTLDEAFLP